MDAGQLLDSARVVPVVKIANADLAVDLARLLVELGFDFLEITLRTPAALDAIREIARSDVTITLGAGSIREPEHMRAAQSAGAQFMVSPGASGRLLDAADELDMPFIPGVMTPSEMIGLLDRGYTLQKFFPAELAGGATALRSLAGPLPEIRYFPTGGITEKEAESYLDLPNVACIGGSWFLPSNLLASGNFEALRKTCGSAADLLSSH